MLLLYLLTMFKVFLQTAILMVASVAFGVSIERSGRM